MENKEILIEKQKVGSSLLDLISILIKYRWFLIWFVFLSSAGAGLYALLSPKWYEATASVFIADKPDLLSAVSGLSSLAKNVGAARGLAALTGENDQADKFKAILKSGVVTMDVINKFKLREEYGYEDDYMYKTLKEWESNLIVEMQEEGNLTITVFDKDPKKAADIANYLVEKLNEINTKLTVTNAKANREFVEKRYLQNLEDIKNLETKMKSFQEKYGLVAVPEQLEATVKSMSNIYAELYRKEVEFNVMKQTYGADHPLVNTSKIEMNELKKKIDQLNSGKDESQKDVKLLIPFKQAPALGNEYLSIYRNLEIQYKILEFIQPLYEQAKVEEARNTPSVLVLDYAGPAERKSKPKISLYILIGFAISLTLGFVIISILETFSRLKSVNPQKFEQIENVIRKDLSRFGIGSKK
ncbi:MAG: Wzz/FepE/Etk N-terminal domain-containing protein [Melioribacteraceae bacterium]|nr:Wzz/FepE/Etk N-terminal domain-containing protein [Melioribacteraceae bacterium]